MARWSRAELESFRDQPVDDLIGPGMRLLFVGINPGLWTAATNTHFCHPSNRFYPALREAGVIDWVVDPGSGMTGEQREDLVDKGIGITNLVNRATVRASELGRDELEKGRRRLVDVVESHQPKVVAVAGVTAYRAAFGERGAGFGERGEAIGPAELWVVPNPSGLNAHETVGTLGEWYRKVAERAGVV
ncbi:MAG: G/U mismatch-specific DNA glycosylase [Acidimicrobiia bacterium]